MFGEERGQPRRDLHQPERHRRGEPHRAARRLDRRHGARLGGLPVGQDAVRIAARGAAGLGEGEAARGAVEQARAEPRFETRHRLRDGGLGQSKLQRRARKRSGIGDLREDGPGFEVGKAHD